MSDKSIFQKIKEHGFKGTMDVAGLKISQLINKEAFYIYQRKPIDSRLIVMESEGDLSDNAYALYDYMRGNGYLQKYHVVWLVDHVKAAEERKQNKTEEFPNTEFVQKVPLNVNLKWAEVLATCKWYIYDHCNLLAPYKKRKETFVVNLWHGSGFKAPKGNNGKVVTPASINFITGKLFENIFEIWFRCGKNQLIDAGYSRNDYLFQQISGNQKLFAQKYSLNKYKKVFLWMPTFRQSIRDGLSENYFESITGLPIIENEELIQKFNKYLSSINSLCIFKVHHLQSELDVFKKKYSNIIVLHDSDISLFNLQLYQIVVFADCLITDYSSIANDYILLNRPIIYTIDDYEEYKNSRGFIPKDPIKYFAGACVKNYTDFINAVQDVADDKDPFKEKRKKILPLMHTHADGNSSQRIINYIGLSLNN